MTEKQKYINRIKKEKQNGLLSVHYFFTSKIFGAKEEEVYAELNSILDAPDLPDPKVLGKYSPSGQIENRILI